MFDVIRWSAERADAVPDVRAKRFLMDHGLPDGSLLFEADHEESSAFATDSGAEVMSIGSFDEDFNFFVDINSGEVLFGLDQDTAPSFTNSSLADFVKCLRWVDDEFPFYSSEDDSAVKSAAGSRALEFFRSVDPECVSTADAFWASFVHDVGIGDYYAGAL
ncbi:SUKH-4 family immunity protein [Streptomyces sp. NPDC047981]|uniref:SUKH-4 family immunity protein n=1 Tax=Streptomyces sp. NPDC047981 TaxID=3154610 RepID=UPI00342AB09B